jgi:hypothetical protein
VPDDPPPPEPEFTRAELENSIPFDVHRTLLGDEGYGLRDDIYAAVTKDEQRDRARTAAAQTRLEDTIDALLANLVVAARNREVATRFVAVPFGNGAHSHTRVTAPLLKSVRDKLLELKLVEGQVGYYRRDPVGERASGAVSRYRPTPKLVALFEYWDVGRRSVGFHPDKPLWRLNLPMEGAGPTPDDVIASCEVLARSNALIAEAEILLPAEAWAGLSAMARRKLAVAQDEDESDEDEDGGVEPQAKWYAGDETAKRLYRAFKHDWDRGGRIYGGWWMQLPKAERSLLTIDGEPVEELDYAQLHPTLLYARSGLRLKGDPYLPPEYEPQRDRVRELGKVTFNRFINTISPARDGLMLSDRKRDRHMLPHGVSFNEYQTVLRHHLKSIAYAFGSGMGVRLQREDSNLAVTILDRLSSTGIVTLPVHDSFIVQRAHSAKLREAMRDAFKEAYGFHPLIR